CSNCSTKRWIKRHFKGEQCPMSKEYNWNKKWKDMEDIDYDIKFFLLVKS
ncbi:36116_t:CDS:1, partial [Gigaspora margarita]